MDLYQTTAAPRVIDIKGKSFTIYPFTPRDFAELGETIYQIQSKDNPEIKRLDIYDIIKCVLFDNIGFMSFALAYSMMRGGTRIAFKEEQIATSDITFQELQDIPFSPDLFATIWWILHGTDIPKSD